jgi:hypothetical protein
MTSSIQRPANGQLLDAAQTEAILKGLASAPALLPTPPAPEPEPEAPKPAAPKKPVTAKRAPAKSAARPAATKSAAVKPKAAKPAALKAPALPRVPQKQASNTIPFTVKVPLSVMPTVRRFSALKGMAPEQYLQDLVDRALENRGKIGQAVIQKPSWASQLIGGPSGSVKVDAARY